MHYVVTTWAVPERGMKGRLLRQNRTHVRLGFRDGSMRWYHKLEVTSVSDYALYRDGILVKRTN